MATRAEVVKFLRKHATIRLYKNLKIALTDVLLALPDHVYKYLTKNLLIVALHEIPMGQAFYFPKPKGEYKLMEFHYRHEMPSNILRYLVAHELGHLMYGQIIPKKGQTWKSMDDMADNYAKAWGFPKTKEIKRALEKLR